MGTPHFVIRPGQGQSPAGGSPVLAGTWRPVPCPLSSAVDRPVCPLPCVGRDPRLVRAAVERAPHPCVSLSHSSVGVHNPAPYATLVVRVAAPSFCPPNDLIPIDVCCPLAMVIMDVGCPLWPVPRAQVGMAMVNRCAPMASGPVAWRQAIDAGPFPQVTGCVRPRPGAPVARAFGTVCVIM
jgi:hypothetical protein